MTNYYCSTRAVQSKFDPLRLFATEAEARAFDRGWAAQFLASRSYDDVAKALGSGDPGLKETLRFLIDEIPDGGGDADAGEARCFR
jgi:predicted HD phosphohydrolase